MFSFFFSFTRLSFLFIFLIAYFHKPEWLLTLSSFLSSLPLSFLFIYTSPIVLFPFPFQSTPSFLFPLFFLIDIFLRCLHLFFICYSFYPLVSFSLSSFLFFCLPHLCPPSKPSLNSYPCLSLFLSILSLSVYLLFISLIPLVKIWPFLVSFLSYFFFLSHAFRLSSFIFSRRRFFFLLFSFFLLSFSIRIILL